MLDKISADMMSNAAKRLATSVETVSSLDAPPKKILRFGWCGSEDCGHKIEEKTELKALRHALHTGGFPGRMHHVW